jgi:hypothetical protein
MEKRRFVHEFALLFLLTLAVGAIVLQSDFKLTGNVFLDGCTGNWSCSEWTTGCVEGNYTRTCTNLTETACVSPIIQYQSCVVENTTCSENWACGNWTGCVNSIQTRTCTDSNSCNTTLSKPEESQSCVVENVSTCTESWTCTSWSNCSNEIQTRTCTDSNSCNTTLSKPEESQSCTCTENWECEDWGNCSGGTKTRTCTDVNSCGTEADLPSLSHSCTTTTTSTESSSSSTDDSSSTEIVSSTCSSNWKCGDWQECIESVQVRACTDLGNCGTQEGMPATSQACVVEIKETCSDKIKNQNETGIDCGGVCKKCSIFTIVGSAISGPIDSLGKVFSNKTNIFIFSGILVLAIVGFFVFKIFKKRKKK